MCLIVWSSLLVLYNCINTRILARREPLYSSGLHLDNTPEGCEPLSRRSLNSVLAF